ncbi:MAG: lysophospholipase [Candidatus Obscuribacterales bacterium]|nr:lysophospholipase [Candidatus Obscuribacterales bacterium]
MSRYRWGSLLALSLATVTGFGHCAIAGESTMPPSYNETINPELAAKYKYTEDGVYSEKLHIPTYQWMPADGKPKAIVLAVHGLTLHGRRFRVLARSLAINGIGFIAMDMRGFGRCHFDDKNQFSTPTDDRKLIDHHKSYEDIAQLAKLIKADYPDQPLIAMGESLGCTFCVELAAENPDLIYGTVLSAPAVKVNKDMYMGNGQIAAGLKSVVTHDHEMDLTGFFAELCSERPDVQKEMLDDPMVLKKITLRRLVATDLYVDKTSEWGKKTPKGLHVLILQGSGDGCVSAKHVTDLMNSMSSDDQSLAWKGKFGHLQLETMFMRAPIIDAIGTWLLSHGKEGERKLTALQSEIADLGGRVTK